MSVNLKGVYKAAEQLKDLVLKTPLVYNEGMSEELSAEVYFKREDLQKVRSYKLRGAYNKMLSLDNNERAAGIVCASAGNHAQGVAYACHALGVRGCVFLPSPTPKQKLRQIEMFGKGMVEVVLEGDTFDDSYDLARRFASKNNRAFIHPFNDKYVIEGQGTVGLEVIEAIDKPIDYLFVPVGGGGLIAGLITVFSALSPDTKIIGVEPEEAASMSLALECSNYDSKLPKLKNMDSFIDGASVRQVGNMAFEVCKKHLYKMARVETGDVCSSLINLYEHDAIVVEPAGALSVAALRQFKDELKGKRVVCVLSGSNNDITRMEEIKERALLYEGLKHYFVLRFPQRAGALKEFASEILGPNDDITHFEYVKKHNRAKGPSVVGIELKHYTDFEPLLERIKDNGYFGEYLNERPDLFQYLV